MSTRTNYLPTQLDPNETKFLLDAANDQWLIRYVLSDIKRNEESIPKDGLLNTEKAVNNYLLPLFQVHGKSEINDISIKLDTLSFVLNTNLYNGLIEDITRCALKVIGYRRTKHTYKFELKPNPASSSANDFTNSVKLDIKKHRVMIANSPEYNQFFSLRRFDASRSESILHEPLQTEEEAINFLLPSLQSKDKEQDIPSKLEVRSIEPSRLSLVLNTNLDKKIVQSTIHNTLMKSRCPYLSHHYVFELTPQENVDESSSSALASVNSFQIDLVNRRTTQQDRLKYQEFLLAEAQKQRHKLKSVLEELRKDPNISFVLDTDQKAERFLQKIKEKFNLDFAYHHEKSSNEIKTDPMFFISSNLSHFLLQNYCNFVLSDSNYTVEMSPLGISEDKTNNKVFICTFSPKNLNTYNSIFKPIETHLEKKIDPLINKTEYSQLKIYDPEEVFSSLSKFILEADKDAKVNPIDSNDLDKKQLITTLSPLFLFKLVRTFLDKACLSEKYPISYRPEFISIKFPDNPAEAYEYVFSLKLSDSLSKEHIHTVHQFLIKSRSKLPQDLNRYGSVEKLAMLTLQKLDQRAICRPFFLGHSLKPVIFVHSFLTPEILNKALSYGFNFFNRSQRFNTSFKLYPLDTTDERSRNVTLITVFPENELIGNFFEKQLDKAINQVNKFICESKETFKRLTEKSPALSCLEQVLKSIDSQSIIKHGNACHYLISRLNPLSLERIISHTLKVLGIDNSFPLGFTLELTPESYRNPLYTFQIKLHQKEENRNEFLDLLDDLRIFFINDKALKELPFNTPQEVLEVLNYINVKKELQFHFKKLKEEEQQKDFKTASFSFVSEKSESELKIIFDLIFQLLKTVKNTSYKPSVTFQGKRKLLKALSDQTGEINELWEKEDIPQKEKVIALWEEKKIDQNSELATYWKKTDLLEKNQYQDKYTNTYSLEINNQELDKWQEVDLRDAIHEDMFEGKTATQATLNMLSGAYNTASETVSDIASYAYQEFFRTINLDNT